MSVFKKTNVKIFAKPSQHVTLDTAYWKKLSVPVLLKEFGPIDYIDFSPVEPYLFAVTCSVRVQVYNPVTRLVHKTISRFRENAYGGKFRSDGQLICVGGEECQVKLFDANSKSLLRVFKGHSAAVRRCFFTSDLVHIASFSDDKTVNVWDIPTEKKLHEFSSHEDYVRAGCVSPVSPTTLISGSYDKKIRMFDTRTSSEAVFTVDHGHPVESLLFLPSGGIFISAGGNEIRVWDALASGRPLARVVQHHKTVTCLCLASDNTRLLSGSLDRHVKVYDVSSFKAVHNMDYPNAILSLGVSANDETIAVGTVDGIVSVSRREIGNEADPPKGKERKKRISYKYMGDRLTPPVNIDSIVPLEKRQAMPKYDTCLRKFQYAKALQSALQPYICNRTPNAVVALMQQLIRRKGLQNAVTNIDEKTLLSLLRFVVRYMGDYRFTSVLVDVSNILLDIYEDKLDDVSPQVLDLFKRLLRKLKEEEELTKELLKLGGAIKMILAASTIPVGKPQIPTTTPPLAPSTTAQQTFVLSVS